VIRKRKGRGRQARSVGVCEGGRKEWAGYGLAFEENMEFNPIEFVQGDQ
jgi:hypothetical protein